MTPRLLSAGITEQAHMDVNAGKKYNCRKTVVIRVAGASVFYGGVMPLCKCSIWIPIRKAPRLCKIFATTWNIFQPFLVS